MSGAVTICSHVKTDGIRCGSPAVSGTALCHHHSVVKATLGRAPSRQGAAGAGQFAPIPFVFAEDRASMQLNYHLLLTAFNENRVDLRRYKLMMSILKAMARNLGKSGSLVEEGRAQGAGLRAQEGRAQGSGCRAQEGKALGSGLRAQEGRDRRPGNGDQEGAAGEVSVALSAAAEKRGKAAGVGGFSFAPDYGFLPSVVSAVTVKPWEVSAGSDPVQEMARKAARVRW